MSKARREQQRDNTREEIKSIARRHMAQHGTNAIALRAIARDMDLTPAALYRYYASLDDLITALILDAFNAMADALEAADKAHPRQDYHARLYNTMLAYRQWALDHPAEFQLIYGNPIPGYEAPADLTRPASIRSNQVMVGILADAYAAGTLTLPTDYAYEKLPPPIRARLDAVTAIYSPDLPPVLLYIAAAGWVRIHGMVMLEAFHHLQGAIGDPEAFYRYEITLLTQSMGLG